MAKPEEFPTLYPFRLHYSDGTTADISATSAEAARKAGQASPKTPKKMPVNPPKIDTEKLLKMADAGNSAADMAKAFRVTASAVRNHLYRHGYAANGLGCFSRRASSTDAAQPANLPKVTLLTDYGDRISLPAVSMLMDNPKYKTGKVGA